MREAISEKLGLSGSMAPCSQYTRQFHEKFVSIVSDANLAGSRPIFTTAWPGDMEVLDFRAASTLEATIKPVGAACADDAVVGAELPFSIVREALD